MVSIYDIAKAAGVSYSTVSLILNNRGDEIRISKKRQEQVLKIAKELGYIPNINARRLISKDIKSQLEIALLWTPLQHPIFLNHMIYKMNELIRKNSIAHMSVTIYPFENHQIETVEKIITGKYAHGVIIPVSSDREIEYLRQLDVTIPLITIYGDTERYHSVDVDDYLNGRLIGQVFKDLDMTQVGIMHNIYYSIGSQERAKGFREYCKENQLEIIADIQNFESSADEVMTEFNRFDIGRNLAKRILNQSRLPQGLFVQDDDSARGVLSYLREHNINVPNDIAIICYGYNSKENEQDGRLTMVEYPMDSLAEKTWELMNKTLDGSLSGPHKILCPTSIYFAGSCPRPAGWIK